MYPKEITNELNSKKLPQTIKFYNEAKFGINIMDQITRYYT